MRTPTAIRKQIEHFKGNCSSDETTRRIWIEALTWVLADLEISVPNAEAEAVPGPAGPAVRLVVAATAAVSALRSYQFGNSSPDLAEEIADSLDTAIRECVK